MLYWKLKRFLLCSRTSSQNQKPLESWESWDLTWLDSLTWIINKTLPPCPHHVGSRQCPPVSGLASAPVLSAVSPSLYLRLMLSVSAPLSSWQLSSWSSDCRCRPSRRLSRSSGTRWPALVTEVAVRSVLDKYRRYCLLFCWFIWRTSGLWQMPNNHASSDVAADNTGESYIQYLSHHLSYHKRGVEEGDDSIRY